MDEKDKEDRIRQWQRSTTRSNHPGSTELMVEATTAGEVPILP